MKLPLAAYLVVPAIVATSQPAPRTTFHDMIIQKLGFTQVQKETVRRVILAHKAAMHAKFDASFQAHADLLQALANPETTPAQIQALESKHSAVHLAMALEINQVVKEIAPILTPEQQAKARQLVVEARARMDAFIAKRK